MKRIIAFLMMILSVVIIAGCGTETASPNATHKSIFTDPELLQKPWLSFVKCRS